LNDLIAGDLTGSGRKQLIFMETAKNYIDSSLRQHRKLVPGDRWQVFEQHTFRGARMPSRARECAVADVTGDKKTT